MSCKPKGPSIFKQNRMNGLNRKGHTNGYKPKTVGTRRDEITFAVPQVREGGFYPTVPEKGLRSDLALVTTLAEMYVQGVSTRKVKAITEELCGVEISAMQFSRESRPTGRSAAGVVGKTTGRSHFSLRGCPLREGEIDWPGA